MAHCIKCNAEVPDDEVGTCMVTHMDLEDVPEGKLKLGDIVCALCFHTIKWPPPNLEDGYTDDDRYGSG